MSKIIKKIFFFSTKYEFIVQCLQTGTLMSCGDILSQSILEDKSIYDSDLRRAAGFFCSWHYCNWSTKGVMAKIFK